jgi:ERCC4-type nuclease
VNVPRDASPQLKTLIGMGMGQQISTRLLEKFGTVNKVLGATGKELMKVEGVGKATVEKLNIAIGR